MPVKQEKKRSSNSIGNANENRAIKELEKDGYKCWKARRMFVQTAQGPRNMKVDMFGAFDIIAAKDDRIRLIQVSTDGNTSHKKSQVEKNFPFYFHTSIVRIEIWSYYQEGRFWKHKDLVMVPGVRGVIGHAWVDKDNDIERRKQ